MMADTKSRWRLHARRVIADTLAALPTTADKKAVVQALAVAYPYSIRSGHAYHCWLKERRLALARLGHAPPKQPKQLSVPTVNYCLRPAGRCAWLEVRCDWCVDVHMGAVGCVACLRHRANVVEAVRDAQFRPLARAALEDSVARLALCDLLEELLGERPEVRGDWADQAKEVA